MDYYPYFCVTMTLRIPISYVLALLCIGAAAQQTDYRSRIIEDSRRAGAVFCPYDLSERVDEAPPAGYRPFYISHFGRHGSRFMGDGEKDIRLYRILHEADSLGFLSEVGRSLLSDTELVLSLASGRYAQLTELGQYEQKRLALRMFRRFRHVFSTRKGLVRAESSTYPRCIFSMSAFTNSLKGEAPRLDFSFAGGEKYQAYIAPEGTVGIVQAMVREKADSFRQNTIKGEKLFSRIFSDRTEAERTVSPASFSTLVYSLGCEAICIGKPAPDVFRYFEADELTEQWIVRNNLSYAWSGRTTETGDIRPRSSAALLRRIIEKADEAITDGGIVADLCFGHDSNLLPLGCLTGIEGMDQNISLSEAHISWFADEHLCMAANIQFIFYRNRKGHILVKILENEWERKLHPGIEPIVGSYYDWTTLREALLQKCD